VIIKENSRASGTDARFVMVGGKNFLITQVNSLPRRSAITCLRTSRYRADTREFMTLFLHLEVLGWKLSLHFSMCLKFKL